MLTVLKNGEGTDNHNRREGSEEFKQSHWRKA